MALTTPDCIEFTQTGDASIDMSISGGKGMRIRAGKALRITAGATTSTDESEITFRHKTDEVMGFNKDDKMVLYSQLVLVAGAKLTSLNDLNISHHSSATGTPTIEVGGTAETRLTYASGTSGAFPLKVGDDDIVGFRSGGDVTFFRETEVIGASAQCNGVLKIPHGTPLPSNPMEGEVFYKTDGERIFVYDGSAWYATPAFS